MTPPFIRLEGTLTFTSLPVFYKHCRGQVRAGEGCAGRPAARAYQGRLRPRHPTDGRPRPGPPRQPRCAPPLLGSLGLCSSAGCAGSHRYSFGSSVSHFGAAAEWAVLIDPPVVSPHPPPAAAAAISARAALTEATRPPHCEIRSLARSHIPPRPPPLYHGELTPQHALPIIIHSCSQQKVLEVLEAIFESPLFTCSGYGGDYVLPGAVEFQVQPPQIGGHDRVYSAQQHRLNHRAFCLAARTSSCLQHLHRDQGDYLNDPSGRLDFRDMPAGRLAVNYPMVVAMDSDEA